MFIPKRKRKRTSKEYSKQEIKECFTILREGGMLSARQQAIRDRFKKKTSAVPYGTFYSEIRDERVVNEHHDGLEDENNSSDEEDYSPPSDAENDNDDDDDDDDDGFLNWDENDEDYTVDSEEYLQTYKRSKYLY